MESVPGLKLKSSSPNQFGIKTEVDLHFMPIIGCVLRGGPLLIGSVVGVEIYNVFMPYVLSLLLFLRLDFVLSVVFCTTIHSQLVYEQLKCRTLVKDLCTED